MTKIKKYLIFTFLTSWTIQIIGAHDLSLDNYAGLMSFSHAVSFCMLMPTLGTLFARADIRGMGWLPDIEKNIRPILLAWLAPTFFQLAGSALYYLVFPDDIDMTGALLREIDPADFEDLKNSGGSYGVYIAKEIFFSLTSFYTFLAVFMGLGEEIGWRGFLYPELKRIFGRINGVLMGGVIHGIWHFPLMLLVGYEYGTNYIGAPFLGLFAFCIFTVTTGIIADFLYEKTHSIWLPALFHGSIDSTFNPYLLGGNERRTIFGPVSIGLISVIPMALFAAGILYNEKRKKEL